jgi:hypothetical protein
VEVRNITKKISDLNCKLDMVSTLAEPRENSYIEYVRPEGEDSDVKNVVRCRFDEYASAVTCVQKLK